VTRNALISTPKISEDSPTWQSANAQPLWPSKEIPASSSNEIILDDDDI
jgi:hypothetical protein